MAEAYVTYFYPAGDWGSLNATGLRSEVIPSGQAGSLTAASDGREMVKITVSGDMWVAFGTAPTATNDDADGTFIASGTTEYFGGMQSGWKVSAIDNS